ncbi:MAG: peptidoglycan-binding protein [Hyphomicrobiaceae bacterium]
MERLLSNVSSHLSATGNRHADILKQLNDRLAHLRHTSQDKPANKATDRHLALFEAQLISLAIKTGVPLNGPVTGKPAMTRDPSAEPCPAGQPAMTPQPAPSAAHDPSLTPLPGGPSPVPPQARRARPSGKPQAVRQPAPPLPTPVAPEVREAAPQPAPAAVTPSAPVQPAISEPQDPLTHPSGETFEKVIAAEQKARAQIVHEREAHADSSDAMFAYQPSGNAPAQTRQEPAPAVPENLSPLIDIADPPPAVAPPPESGTTSPLSRLKAVIGEGPPDTDISRSGQTDRKSADESSLGKDLDIALSDGLKDLRRETQLEVPEAVVPVPPETDKIAPAETGIPQTENESGVFDQIQNLTRQVEHVSGSVDRLASDLAETRAEFPELVEKTAASAARQAAAHVAAGGPDVSNRIDQLQNLIEDHFAASRSAPGSSHKSAPRHFEVQEPEHGPLGQARKSMLERLAPVGEAISRVKNRATQTEQYAPAPADMPASEMTVSDPEEFDAAEIPPEADIYPEQTIPMEGGQHPAERPISDMRRSLFQSIRDGSPPALVLALVVLTVTSTALIWSKVGGGEQIAEATTKTVASLPQPPEKKPDPATRPVSPAQQATVTRRTTATRQAGHSIEHTGSTSAIEPSASIRPVEPTALKPEDGLLAPRSPESGGSHLDLPPLATGPLSLRVAAANGDPAAQFDVASRLAQGNGIARDPVAAVKWYTRAASAGHAQAQYRLAALYERGTGVASDSGRAKVWYTRAAQQGNVKAMHNLAVLYAGQSGGAPNYVNAVQWFERAAEHDLADSQFNVAILYLNGLGVAKDAQAAYKWFALAARQGDQEAARRLKGLASHLAASDVSAAKKLVRNWRAKPIIETANRSAPWQPKGAKPKPVANLPFTTQTVPAGATTSPPTIGKNEITRAQSLLGELGFDAGTPDGQIGSKTRSAIKSFQSRNGMIPTGDVDPALLQRLERAKRERAAKLGQL